MVMLRGFTELTCCCLSFVCTWAASTPVWLLLTMWVQACVTLTAAAWWGWPYSRGVATRVNGLALWPLALPIHPTYAEQSTFVVITLLTCYEVSGSLTHI
jgi:hypothetical protein